MTKPQLPNVTLGKQLNTACEALFALVEAGHDWQTLSAAGVLLFIHDVWRDCQSRGTTEMRIAEMARACMRVFRDAPNDEIIEKFMRMDYKAHVYKDKPSGYSAEMPDLPGCFAQGQTYQEALVNLTFAMRNWLYVAQKQPHPYEIPLPGSAHEGYDKKRIAHMTNEFVDDCTDALDAKQELEAKVDNLRQQIRDKGETPHS